MRTVCLAALIAMLTGCSTAAPPTSAPPPPAPAPVAPQPAPPTLTPAADACGAAAAQHLVGRPRSEAPVPLKPELQRVMCTTCPATMDYNQNRLNILFDATTGLIKEVRCG